MSLSVFHLLICPKVILKDLLNFLLFSQLYLLIGWLVGWMPAMLVLHLLYTVHVYVRVRMRMRERVYFFSPTSYFATICASFQWKNFNYFAEKTYSFSLFLLVNFRRLCRVSDDFIVRISIYYVYIVFYGHV